MTKLSDEQIKKNKDARNRASLALNKYYNDNSELIRSHSISTRLLADLMHYFDSISIDNNFANARVLYKLETTPVKKMVTREVKGQANGNCGPASSNTGIVILKNVLIPRGTKVRVIYEVEEES